MRRIALLAAAAAGMAMLVPSGSAAALGGTLTASFVCENTLVTSAGIAGTAINAPAQDFTSTVVMPASADADNGASALVTITPADGGTMPLSPPVELTGVEVDELQVRLDIYRSTTNAAVDISLPMDMSSGTAALAPAPFTQAASTAWLLPSPFAVTVPVTGAAGQRAWVRVKSFGFTWSKPGQYTGTTTCRLAATEVFPTGPTTVEQPIFGALTPLSRQFPADATDVDLDGTETQVRAQFADRVTFSAGDEISSDGACNVVDQTGCTTGERISTTVFAGQLSQQIEQAASNPSAEEIVLREQGPQPGPPFIGPSSVSVSPIAQVVEGALNPVTVTDVRGGIAGWSLTAELDGPFSEVGFATMDPSLARLVAVACTPVTGSATSAPGTGGSLEAAVTLCGVQAGMDDSAGQSGSGQYVVEARFELTIPPYQKAGDYTAALLLTLT